VDIYPSTIVPSMKLTYDQADEILMLKVSIVTRWKAGFRFISMGVVYEGRQKEA
jgi:hypothetical protein